jgi:hypothetical protein
MKVMEVMSAKTGMLPTHLYHFYHLHHLHHSF